MADTARPNRLHLETAAIILFILPFLNGFFNPRLIGKPVIFWTVDIIEYVIVPFAVIVFLFTRSGLRPVHIGLQLPKERREWTHLIAHTILFSFVFCVAAEYVAGFFDWMYPGKPLFSYDWMNPAGKTGKLLTTFYFGLTAGLVEEFYYRGLLVELFEQYNVGQLFQVLLISALFAVVHWEGGVQRILTAFFLSVGITAYYIRYRMLVPVIAGHLAYDWIYFFIQPQ